MSYARVMCLVRGDDSDPEVIATAVALSNGSHRSIRFVYVIVVDRRFELASPNLAKYAEGERILLNAEQSSGLRNETLGSILQARSIGQVLVREAMDFDAEVVVLSAKIISTMNSKRIDSDSEYLIANAPCTVILVRDAIEEFGSSNGLPAKRSEGVIV